MLTVTKEFVWDSAHMLYGHGGLCKNVHGHTYKMHVELAHNQSVITRGPSKGMVMDFKDLKELVKERLVDQLDHAFITSGQSKEEIILVEVMTELNMKVYDLGARPTAENMARIFAEKLNNDIQSNYDNIRVVSVTVWETPTSFAKYIL